MILKEHGKYQKRKIKIIFNSFWFFSQIEFQICPVVNKKIYD